MVTKSVVMENDNKKIYKMGILVDAKRRLSSGNEDKSIVMASYIGNVLSIPFSEKMITKLKEKPLSWVVDAVHDNLEGATTNEPFLGIIDWVKAHHPKLALEKIYYSGSSKGSAFFVSSRQRFPMSKVDFGRDKPSMGSYHCP